MDLRFFLVLYGQGSNTMNTALDNVRRVIEQKADR